jgi:hypothetical protein
LADDSKVVRAHCSGVADPSVPLEEVSNIVRVVPSVPQQDEVI